MAGTELMAALVSGGFATSFAAAVLALPAVVATRRLLSRRLAVPLERGWLEDNLVVVASVAGALSATAHADAAALAVSPLEPTTISSALLFFVAPAPLGAIPWVAGELLSGASSRQLKSLAAAMGAACAVSWGIWCLAWMGVRAPLSPGLVAMQLASTLLASFGAARAYLAVRGEPRDYSSSISEKRSFLGSSFFC